MSKIFILLIMIWAQGSEAAQHSAIEGTRSHLQRINTTLMAATSPFEDLTEYAIAADEQGMDRALVIINSQISATRSVLDSTHSKELNLHLSKIRAARVAGQFDLVAINAIESYRVLVDGLNDEVLIIPKAVSLLDYVGFKLTFLTAYEKPNWTAIQSTVMKAHSLWASIAERVQSNGLRDAMDTTIDGLVQATAAQNVQMIAFAAHVDLDLVDLLEDYFSGSALEAENHHK